VVTKNAKQNKTLFIYLFIKLNFIKSYFGTLKQFNSWWSLKTQNKYTKQNFIHLFIYKTKLYQKLF